MRELLKEKRRLYDMYFRTKSEHDGSEYKRKNKEVMYKV